MQAHGDSGPPQPQAARPTPDPDEPEGLAARATRRKHPWALAIGAAGTLAIVVVVVATADSGYTAAPTPEINALLAGIPEHGNALGSSTAPITMQYFGDLECPTARTFTLGILPYIIRKWVRSEEMRIEYRSLRSVSEPKTFGVQQVAALAAGMQDKLWYYLEYFYHEQGPEHTNYVTVSYLSDLARQVSDLNLGLWSHDRHDQQLAAQVAKDGQTALAAHLNNTPSFLVGRTGSAPLFSLSQYSTLGDINYAIRRTLHS